MSLTSTNQFDCDCPLQHRQTSELVGGGAGGTNSYRYSNSWKLITVLIGGNDLCEVCRDPINHGVAIYQQNMIETFNRLKMIPRAIINVPLHPDCTCGCAPPLGTDTPEDQRSGCADWDQGLCGWEGCGCGCAHAHLCLCTRCHVEPPLIWCLCASIDKANSPLCWAWGSSVVNANIPPTLTILRVHP